MGILGKERRERVMRKVDVGRWWEGTGEGRDVNIHSSRFLTNIKKHRTAFRRSELEPTSGERM